SDNARAPGDLAEDSLGLGEREPLRLRHEDGELGRIEDVGVEGDIGAGGTLEGAGDALLSRVDALRTYELLLGRVEVAGAHERHVRRLDRAGVDQLPQRCRPEVPCRRALDGVEIAVCVEPDHRQSVLAGGQTLDGADVRAAAAAEDERALRKIRCECERLLFERFGLDDRGLRIGQVEPRRLRHRLTALTPRLWNSYQPSEVDTTTRVALVLGAERDRREGSAVRTLRPQATHASSFLNATASSTVAGRTRKPSGGDELIASERVCRTRAPVRRSRSRRGHRSAPAKP